MDSFTKEEFLRKIAIYKRTKDFDKKFKSIALEKIKDDPELEEAITRTNLHTFEQAAESAIEDMFTRLTSSKINQ